MAKIRLFSWNVNGLRAAYRKGFMDWFQEEQPDILGLQETRATEAQLPEALKNVPGYQVYFAVGKKPGYSGVGLYTKIVPHRLEKGFGNKRFDEEGRTLKADFGSFILFNVYFPNGGASEERLQYKLDFYEAFLAKIQALLAEDKKIIICGDVNTAHREIDLANPKENAHVSGFLPVERAWIDKLLETGFIDTFRMFEKGPEHYTWWDMRTRARRRNAGWRLDYFFVSKNLKTQVVNASILANVMGSDHCPISLELII